MAGALPSRGAVATGNPPPATSNAWPPTRRLLSALSHPRCALPSPPSQYTFILPASKALPNQVVDPQRGKTRQRLSVGVRWPDAAVVQALMADAGGCLLSHRCARAAAAWQCARGIVRWQRLT